MANNSNNNSSICSKGINRCKVGRVSVANNSQVYRRTSKTSSTMIECLPKIWMRIHSTMEVVNSKCCQMTPLPSPSSRWPTARKARSRAPQPMVMSKTMLVHHFRWAWLRRCTSCRNRSNSRLKLSSHPVVVVDSTANSIRWYRHVEPQIMADSIGLPWGKQEMIMMRRVRALTNENAFSLTWCGP